MGVPLLVMDGVTFHYEDGRAQGLRGVNLTVDAGEWIAVAGANGSGKSTMMRLAAGLLQPTSGSIRWAGEAGERARSDLRIGFLSQHPEEFVVGLTVWEDVAFGPSQCGLSEGEVAERVEEALRIVGLVHRAHSPIDTLSGGELQRIALAGVLALRPRLLLLDEPTANADPALRMRIRTALEEYRRATGAAVVWVTHRAEEIMAAERVVLVHEGEVAFDGTPAVLAADFENALAWGIPPLRGEGGTQRSSDSVGGVGGSQEPQGRVLDWDGVCFSYSQGELVRPVLKGGSLRLDRGQMGVLVGASGAGKSTLLQIAALLLRHEGGRLRLFGEEVPAATGRPTRDERRHFFAFESRVRGQIGVAFQEPEKQFFALTVEEEFRFNLEQAGVPQTEWPERMSDALGAVGMEADDVLSRSPYHLSGGERRRIAIALGIAQRPGLYLLDEPTAGLDYWGAQQIVEALNRLREQTGCAILIATHDPEWIESAGVRPFHLVDGIVSGALGEMGNLEAGAEENVIGETPSEAHGQTRDEPWLLDVDPRLRIVGASLLAVTIAFSPLGIGLALAGVIVLALFRGAAYPLREALALWRGLLPFLLAAILFATIRVDEGGLHLSGEGFYEGLLVSVRVLLLVSSVAWLTYVGGIGEMLGALRSLTAPLRRLGLPWDALSAATVLGARMLPVLRDEAERIRIAQVARGVERQRGLRDRWTRIASLVIPLSVAVLRRAERLGEALQLRGFREGASQWMEPRLPSKRLGWKDLLFAGWVLFSVGLLMIVR